MRKPNPIQINIPQPCHEDWNKMTPMQQGKYCDSCKKCVVDFRRLSDKAIYEYVLQHKGEHICGRFHSDQLNRAISLPPQPHSRLYRYFIGLGLTLLFTQIPVDHAGAKTPYAFNISHDKTQDNTQDSITTIKGKVLDEKKAPLEGAVILLYNGTRPIGGNITDAKGEYSISISTDSLKDAKIIQKVSCVGYNKQTLYLEFNECTAYHHIQLEPGGKVTQGIIVEQYKVPLIDLYEPSKTIITDDDIEHMAH